MTVRDDTGALKGYIYSALANAKENGYLDLCYEWSPDLVVKDLKEYDSDLEDAKEEDVYKHVVSWRKEYPQ